MKVSDYNFYINDDKENIHLIYNALRNTLVSDDDSKVQNFMKQCDDDIKFHPEYLTEDEYNDLISSGIIVSDDLDEKKNAIEINRKRLDILSKKDEHLSLVIAPTLRCNFNCYYCFESKNNRNIEDSMNMEVQNDILNFIEKSILQNHIKNVSIIWYGGEPLIQQNIIFFMQKKINEICKSYHVKVYSHMITNGVLLTTEISDLLFDHGISGVQITIDGPEHIHNKRRYYPAEPTNNYNLILENILNANNNIRFNIRINIDKNNMNFVFAFINDLIERKIWPHKKNVFITPALVKPEQVESDSITNFVLSKKDYLIFEDRIRRYLMEKYNEISLTNKAKLKFNYPKFGGEAGCGYGIFKNLWIISYNGDIFRCWDFIGVKKHAIGTMKDLLDDFGRSIVNKIKIDNTKFEQWGCFDCKFFPICGAECPWEFSKNNEKRRCTEWKSVLEYRLLNQYKLYLKEPKIFKNVLFA